MNLAELRAKLQFLVNVNPGQTSQDFAGPAADVNKRYDGAINEAYRDEVSHGKTISRSWFRRAAAFTWTADAESMTIPEWARGRDVEVIRDDTDASPGTMIYLRGPNEEASGLYRSSGDTWTWTPAPDSERTLTIIHMAEAAEMTADAETPELIPPMHHDLLVWGAAILLKIIGDEDAPKRWVERHTELRFLFHKELSRGNPRAFPAPGITNHNRGI